ncbi:hypothetical protein A3Q56_04123 [Intoshia linei]|uniref:Uncharacterized protein n=1 Tax=Intoshia linei TaxID=1819745 RepID=A0A177B3C2_9BILA|nr:hypothetical protein A3Q56_04123 [Intoshia linei]
MHSFNNNVSNVPSTSNDKLNKNFAQIINANDLSITLPVSTITFSPSPLKLSSIKLKDKKTTFLIADESIKEKDTLVDIKNNKKCKYRQPIIYLKKASTSIIPLGSTTFIPLKSTDLNLKAVNYEYSSSNNSTPPPTTPASVSELLNRNNCLIYEHGNFKKDDTYKQFQKNSTGVWGSIITLFKQYEKLYKAYNVNIAYMNPKM